MKNNANSGAAALRAAHALQTIGDEFMSSGNFGGEFKKANHMVGINEFHFEFCPKYRYKCMKNPYIKNEITEILFQTAKEHRIAIRKIAVVEDHLHMDAFIPFDMSVTDAQRRLKGRSAYLIFRRFPNFRKKIGRAHV